MLAAQALEGGRERVRAQADRTHATLGRAAQVVHGTGAADGRGSRLRSQLTPRPRGRLDREGAGGPAGAPRVGCRTSRSRRSSAREQTVEVHLSKSTGSWTLRNRTGSGEQAVRRGFVSNPDLSTDGLRASGPSRGSRPRRARWRRAPGGGPRAHRRTPARVFVCGETRPDGVPSSIVVADHERRPPARSTAAARSMAPTAFEPHPHLSLASASATDSATSRSGPGSSPSVTEHRAGVLTHAPRVRGCGAREHGVMPSVPSPARPTRSSARRAPP